MSKYTSFKIGGPADLFAQPADVTDLQALLRWSNDNKVKVFILGAGTNLLVSDLGIRGLVIQLEKGFKRIVFSGNKVTAGSAVRLPTLLRRTLGAGLSGLEGLAGIPGSVGGAVCMNAGTPHGCISNALEKITALDAKGDLYNLSVSDLGLGYRSSIVSRKGLIILEAEFLLQAVDSSKLADIVKTVIAKRKSNQPSGVGTAGSVFKNPPNGYAGRILDAIGAKGIQIGGARVSGKHANFIENTGMATAEDVRQLVFRLQRLAKEKQDVDLDPEIQFVGEWR